MLEGYHYLSRAERREALHEYAGHRLSERMLEEFRLLDASAYANVPKSKLYVVNTSSKAGFSVQGFLRMLYDSRATGIQICSI